MDKDTEKDMDKDADTEKDKDTDTETDTETDTFLFCDWGRHKKPILFLFSGDTLVIFSTSAVTRLDFLLGS
jgi:hypothetical protein